MNEALRSAMADPSIGLTASYRNLGMENREIVPALAGMDSSIFREGYQTVRLMERGAIRSLGMMTMLGLAIPGATEATKYLHDALMVGLAANAIYELYHAAILSETALEEAQAAIELAANAVAQNWVGIALAIGAAAGVYAALNISSGNWNFNGDYSTPLGRMDAKDKLAGVMNG